jgi:hypothetical protein
MRRPAVTLGITLAVVATGVAFAATTGISTQQARTGTPSAVNGASSTAEGSSLSFARADHQHGPSQTLRTNTLQSGNSASTTTASVPALSIEPSVTLDANDALVGIRDAPSGSYVWKVDKEGDVTAWSLTASTATLSGALTADSAEIGTILIGTGTISGADSIYANSDVNGNTLTATTSSTLANATASSLAVNGAIINAHLSATASLDFTALAANSCEVLTISVSGAADGNTVVLGVPNALADVDGATERTVFYGWVSASNTVSVRRCNVTGTVTANPAAATVRADVWQH